MISFEKVVKSYPGKRGRKLVLQNLSHQFPRGKHTAIIGRNGAGKSTLMRLLSGAELPDSGRVVRKGSVSWPLGFRGGLHGSLTGRENVAFISRIYGEDAREMLDYVEDFADIGKAMDDETKGYSSGMRARVAFGISMAINFDYYLIDEVIAVGDRAFQNKCKRVLADRLQSSTVLLVSHSNVLMRDFCQHGVVLEQGKLHSFTGIDEAIDYYENVVTAPEEQSA
jgi:capsular polysaccharide transport system ATP-binding protein